MFPSNDLEAMISLVWSKWCMTYGYENSMEFLFGFMFLVGSIMMFVPIKWFGSYDKSSMIRVVYDIWIWEFHGILIWFHVFSWFYHDVCERFVVVMGGLQWLWWWKCDKVTKIGTLIPTWIENLDIVLYWILVHK